MVNIDLRLGDCLEIMKDIPDKSVDAVITDPPYGINFKYNNYIDKPDGYGDWSRVVTKGALSCCNGNPAGVFLDPPYSQDVRNDGLYNHDIAGLAVDVLEWCKANGDNPRYRIALCGYEGEHNILEDVGWSVYKWKANRAYGNANGESENSANRALERIWFSPYCLSADNGQRSLFE